MVETASGGKHLSPQLLVWLLKVDDPCHALWAERCVYQAEEKWVYQVQSGGQGVWCW